MREMKDSGIEWIGEIPVDWNLLPVKRFFKHEKRIVGKFVDDYERLALTMQGVIKRSKDDSEGLQPEKFEGYQILRKNELVFKLIDLENVKTSRVGISSYTGLVSPAYIILSNNRENNRFAYYWFMFMYYNEIFNRLGGVGVRSALNAKDVLALHLPAISQREQTAIVSYLDKKCSNIDAIITKNEKIIEKLKEYKSSLITETVTKGLNPDVEMKDSGVEWIGKIPLDWDIVKVKYTGDFENGLTYSPNDITDETGVLVLRSSNIQSGNLDFNDCVYVFNAPNDLMVKRGDIIICSRNGSVNLVGKSVYIDNDIGATFGAFMMRYRTKIFDKFAFYMLQSVISYYKSFFATSTINQLTIKTIRQMVVALPPVAEQTAIAAYLDKKCSIIDTNIAKRELINAKLTEYKKSLIYEVVTGKKEI